MIKALENWFDLYQIAHKIEYANGTPARITPMDKLVAERKGNNHWYINGKLVSRKFVAALQRYYA